MDAPLLSSPEAGRVVVGQYVLTHRLGVGGMGEVWMGQRAAIGGAAKSVAVKMLAADRAHDQVAKQMLLDEARLSMLLSNSNIVQVFDVGETDEGVCFLAMEWVDGLNLAELSGRLRESGETLPKPIIAYIVGEVLKALAYAHDLAHAGARQAIIHRDVSPHNVMLSVSGEVKLMDFGVAKMTSEETSTAQVKGKLRYMPPEQLRGETRDPTIDLFAVGAILHELLDGRKFRGEVVDDVRMIGMILSGDIPPLDRPAGEIPVELERLRIGLLCADPRDRLPTARAAYRELEHWPGYRDTKFELQDLVRRFVGADAPRTGVSSHTLTLRDRPRRDAEGSQTDVSRSSTRSEQTGSGRRIPIRRGFVVGVIMMGMAVAASLGGVFVGSRRDRGPAPLRVNMEALENHLPPPHIEIPRRSKPEPPPLISAPELESLIEPTSTDDETLPLVLVTLEAPGYRFWVQVTIAGKRITLDKLIGNSKSIKLKPGSHRVAYREEPEGPWRSAGTLVIPPGGPAHVVLRSGRARLNPPALAPKTPPPPP
jgi:serine/threonine protein kinase